MDFLKRAAVKINGKFVNQKSCKTLKHCSNFECPKFCFALMKFSFSAKLMAENREMISDLENCSQVAAQHLSKFANIIWLEEE